MEGPWWWCQRVGLHAQSVSNRVRQSRISLHRLGEARTRTISCRYSWSFSFLRHLAGCWHRSWGLKRAYHLPRHQSPPPARSSFRVWRCWSVPRSAYSECQPHRWASYRWRQSPLTRHHRAWPPRLRFGGGESSLSTSSFVAWASLPRHGQ